VTVREAESAFERAMHNFDGAVRVHQSAPQDSCIVEDCKVLEASRAALVAAAESWVAAARAEALQEAEAALWERVGREEYGHAKAAVTLDIDAIRALARKGVEP